MAPNVEQALRMFYDDVDEYTDKVVPSKIIAVQKSLIKECFTKIVQRTPVDTGRARANWQLTRTTPSSRVFKSTDKTGEYTIEKMLRVLEDLEPYGTFYITNNLDYIEYLEEGSSSQAPNGMVEVTVAELYYRMFA